LEKVCFSAIKIVGPSEKIKDFGGERAGLPYHTLPELSL